LQIVVVEPEDRAEILLEAGLDPAERNDESGRDSGLSGREIAMLPKEREPIDPTLQGKERLRQGCEG
jgi:hypothetical protein